LIRCEVHPLKCGAAKEAIRIAERFRQFEMIVSFGNDEPYGFAGSFDGCGEIPGLALKLRRLEGPVAAPTPQPLAPLPSSCGFPSARFSCP
jgi:hypothetical protein